MKEIGDVLHTDVDYQQLLIQWFKLQSNGILREEFLNCQKSGAYFIIPIEIIEVTVSDDNQRVFTSKKLKRFTYYSRLLILQ